MLKLSPGQAGDAPQGRELLGKPAAQHRWIAC